MTHELKFQATWRRPMTRYTHHNHSASGRRRFYTLDFHREFVADKEKNSASFRQVSSLANGTKFLNQFFSQLFHFGPIPFMELGI